MILVFFSMIAVILGLLLVVAPALIGMVLLIIALLEKDKLRKDQGPKKSKTVRILSIVGCLFMLPLIISLIYVGSVVAEDKWENYNSLPYNVNHGNYARVEALLKKGVDPDCTLYSNKPAAEGERTLLSYMCENVGYVNSNKNPVDAWLTREEREMMQLLIDYGADVNRAEYWHDEDNERHTFQEEEDYENNTDKCGFTPLMYAVRSGELATVQFLMENGADVNAADYCGYTPVHIAVDNLDNRAGAEMLQYLIEQGADVTAVTNFGQDVNFLFYRNDKFDRSHMQKVLKEVYEDQS